jgi:hypothetical protein
MFPHIVMLAYHFNYSEVIWCLFSTVSKIKLQHFSTITEVFDPLKLWSMPQIVQVRTLGIHFEMMHFKDTRQAETFVTGKKLLRQ